jgi:hypothetical protein
MLKSGTTHARTHLLVLRISSGTRARPGSREERAQICRRRRARACRLESRARVLSSCMSRHQQELWQESTIARCAHLVCCVRAMMRLGFFSSPRPPEAPAPTSTSTSVPGLMIATKPAREATASCHKQGMGSEISRNRSQASDLTCCPCLDHARQVGCVLASSSMRRDFCSLTSNT